MTREVVSTSDAPAAIGPYSQAMKASGSFYFMSGQIPLRADGTLVDGDVRAQATQVIENMGAVLKAAGLDFSNIVKTTIFLSSMDHFATVNEIYGSAMGSVPPARSTVAVAGLPRGVDVEIEAIAVF
ncbi:MAG: RidA family protein [Armatimonadetes bacterium]|nr:RidA family protein [Armatimonadota bacterium]